MTNIDAMEKGSVNTNVLSNIQILEEIRNSYFEANKPIEDDKSYLIDFFMMHCIDELKSQADRMAGIEKAMAELEWDDDGSHLIKFDTGKEIKVEETD